MRASFRDPYCGPETVDHHTGEPGGGRAPCDDGHMVVMSDEEFEAAVDDALEAVPGELLDIHFVHEAMDLSQQLSTAMLMEEHMIKVELSY